MAAPAPKREFVQREKQHAFVEKDENTTRKHYTYMHRYSLNLSSVTEKLISTRIWR
jgi:hypothetical protein